MPCVLRPDLALDGDAADGDRAAQAGHVGAMLAENLHRQGLSAVEEARGVQAMLDLGVPLARVAKSTGLGRKRVAKAAGVARLDGDTAAAVAGAGLTLDQAAAVAVYAGDPDTTATLIAAAGEGPGRFAHALTRAKQARAEAERAAALLAELTAAGRTVLDEDTGRARHPAGRPRARRPAADRRRPRRLPRRGGLRLHHRLAGATAGRGVHRPGRQRPPRPLDGHRPARQRSSRRPQRGRTRGRRGRTAGHHREQQGDGGGQRDPPGVGQGPAAAQDRARRRRCGSPSRRWPPTRGRCPGGCPGSPTVPRTAAAADLGIDAPGQWWTTREQARAHADQRRTGARRPARRGAAGPRRRGHRIGLHRQSWRNPGAGDARWLRFLASCGYTLADIERQIVDAADQPTADPAPDAT